MLQTIDKKYQRVHIINVGYETDWMINSLKESKPDKVYLTRDEAEDEDGKRARKKVSLFLKRKKIPFEELDRSRDIYQLIHQIKEVIEKEKENTILMGLTSGPRDSMSALILSSLLFRNVAKEICLYSFQQGHFIELPSFEIILPEERIVELIKFLHTKKEGVVKKDIRDYMFKRGHLKLDPPKKGYNDEEHVKYVILNRSVIGPAEKKWKFISTEGNRRGCKVKLTPEGEKWARMFS